MCWYASIDHHPAILGTIRENGETFLTMAAFHGIPSSNLLDGQSVSRERLHDMFCPAPQGSLRFGLMCLSVDCVLCTGHTRYGVDCVFRTTLVVAQQGQGQGCRVAVDRWPHVSLRGHNDRRIGDTTASCSPGYTYLGGRLVPGYLGTHIPRCQTKTTAAHCSRYQSTLV